ncbi:3-oxo-tetronate kinase [Ruegeria arenilitoris]|uniref:3-oxo-tetronate kinase n=1 Tax=Ruegeria arenilitoris TaxID=1173585 RepID=UPI00147A46F8|nr:3-oxo-tetronate kinase [Ruegeria arenilitoris]
MTTVLGCIADDFTGATDLAALLARSGVRVSLRIGVPAEAAACPAPFEIVALKSRTAPVDKAVAEARAALRWLQGSGAKRFFWKYCSTFDSTAKGNIGPVAEALMDDLGARQTIYCPAFPENGRSIFMGNLFVGRQPLSESPMKDHPLTPMRDSNLMRLLQPQVTRRVGLSDRLIVEQGPCALRTELDALRAEGVAHVVIDAVASSDLDVIAKACRDMPLLTGGSALAMPLPGLYLEDRVLAANAPVSEAPPLDPAAIILSGSCSAMTNRQVADYTRTGAPSLRLDPLELAEVGVAPVHDWVQKQPFDRAPIIYATAEPESVKRAQKRLGIARAGEIIEEALAACALTARQSGARRFVVAGGETSGAVTRALGLDCLSVGAEIAPGVPWCYGHSDGHQIALTLKSGNFGTERFFSEALEKLEVR